MRSSSPASPSPSPRLRSLSSSVSLPRTYSRRGQKRRPERALPLDFDTNDDQAPPGTNEHSPQPRGKRSRPSPSSQELVRETLGKASEDESIKNPVETSVKRPSRHRNGDLSPTEESGPAVAGPSTVPPLRPKSPTTPRASRFRPDTTPKDLSSLFPSPSRSAPASSPFGSPNKALSSGDRRRMLTKTQSLGQSLKNVSNESSPSSLAQRTRSMPDTPSKSVEYDSPNRPQLFTNLPTSVMEGTEQPRSGGAKRTYGSKRTIREIPQASAEDDEDGAGLNIGATSYADLRKRYEVTNPVVDNTDGDDNGADLNIARPPQVVSDMRSKGENRRFIDEIDFLLEGLSDPRTLLSVRRSSSMEVLTQLQDEDWLSRALVCGQIERLWESLWTARGEGDVIMDIICAIFIATLAVSELSFDGFVTVHADELRSSLVAVLKRPTGEYKALASKRMQVLSESLLGKISSLGMQSSTVEVAPRQLACFLLVKMTSWSIDPSQDAAGRTKLLSVIMSVLAESTNALQKERARTKMTASPLVLSNLSVVSDCLDIASSLVSNDSTCLQYLLSRASKWSESFCHLVLLRSGTDDTGLEGDSHRLHVIEEHVYHLLALLANVSPDWALAILHATGFLEALASQVIRSVPLSNPAVPGDQQTENDDDVRTEDSDTDDAHDKADKALCVVLAVLFGLITHGPAETPSRLGKIQIGGACAREGKCKKRCTCKRRFDTALAKAYSTQVATRSTATDSYAIVTGYMAVLLTSFLSSEPPDPQSILTMLRGDIASAKVDGLRQSIRGLCGLQDLVLGVVPRKGDGMGDCASGGGEEEEEVNGHDDDMILNGYMSMLDDLEDRL